MLTEESEVKEVTGITDNQKRDILNFLQGEVYCWCKNRKNEWFAARDLVGGDNSNWENIP